MDSFIDKLAQKFTAQEIIKANSSAEAAELKRTREQVQQYEACLEEMKNVNESMKESLAKLEQSLDIDFEKFGREQVSADDIHTAIENAIEDGVGDISAVIAENMNAIKETQNEAKLQQDLAQEQMSGQLRDIQDKLSGQLAGQIQSIQDCVSGQLQEQLEGVQNSISGQMNEKLQGVQDIMSGQLSGQIQSIQDCVSGQLQEQLQGVQSSLSEQVQSIQGTQDGIAERLQGVLDAQDKLNGQMLSQVQDMQTVQDAQEKLSIQVTGQLHAVQDKILQQMRVALAASSEEKNNEFSEAQLAALKEQANAQLDTLKTQTEGQLGLQKEQIVDYVHKENVKVYRNVQAVVVDEANKQSENMSTMLNKVTAKNQLLVKLVIASLACSGVSLAAVIVLLLRSLGII